ncbi:MAG TPA: glutamate-cysteine ligase family protein, partial [Gammaproteobacteria bacterium]|nr:glutamate-cysteine ligase family protein [Gammaproteobacteria bacterium]
GVDTSFDCSRLTVISAFPLSGTPPWILHWDEFENYYNKMVQLGVISSMKDFYWDIRPKPEFGTVELRICDTPLTVEKAAQLAAYMQTLVLYLLTERPPLSHDVYLTYLMNRFRAARYGFEGIMIDPAIQAHTRLGDDILDTCRKIQPYAETLKTESALNGITESVIRQENGAKWLRENFANLQSLNDIVRAQSELWRQASA